MSSNNNPQVPFFRQDWFRYVFPFVVFMLLTEIQATFSGSMLFCLYALKSAIVGGMLYALFKGRKAEFPGSFHWMTLVLGTLGFLVWIGIGNFLHTDTEVTFNPEIFSEKWKFWLAVFARTAGAVLVVPVMEELLWRSFAMRYIIDEKFSSIEIGAWNPKAFWITVILFTVVHVPADWPACVLYGIMIGYWVVKTKNLVGAMYIHAVTNLLLAAYVVATGSYFYW
jgi:CAAX prenyl protease-like protein